MVLKCFPSSNLPHSASLSFLLVPLATAMNVYAAFGTTATVDVSKAA